MPIKKNIWNAVVIIAITFLVLMLGVGHRLGPLPHFSSIPKPPALNAVTFKKIEVANVSLETPALLTSFVSPNLGIINTRNEAKSRAVAWVLRVRLTSQANENWVQKLQAKQFPAYGNPRLSAQNTSIIFVGPYVYRQEAEQVQKTLKTTFGLNGDVVKFDPLAVPSNELSLGIH